MQTELHRHLDISLRLSTLLELAQARGFEAQSTSLERFREKIVLTQPLTDLAAVIETFELFPKVLDCPESLERIAFEVVEDCYREGTRRAELRFSPSFVSGSSSMNWEDVLEGFERGVKKATQRYPEMQVGLICIATREFGPDAVGQTVEFYLRHRSRFIGLDLAGKEDQFPCRQFEDVFREAVSLNSPITIHAGEGTGPQNIWEAIEILGARRIGHGIGAIHDPLLMKHLRENRICLEVCPTSNWITGCVADLAQHPLPELLRAGVPVSINTDDPAVFGVDLPHELELVRTRMGMSEAEIQLCQRHALDASFLRTKAQQ